ncbi:hypothetical protein [Microbispora sp. H10830]|uniref:hypothetical protein n=1 Tax=Microbispora sp. H10830 TaxID=2729109 RepID=UPI001600B1E7|nr:hypothetical protein [Microbispora sp. H10830]
MFIQRDEPTKLEYGGSKKPTGLAEALDNARILREFENDDLHAFRALKSAVRRHGADASPVDPAALLPVHGPRYTALVHRQRRTTDELTTAPVGDCHDRCVALWVWIDGG